MTKLNSNIDSRLSDAVILQLQRKDINTVIQFVNEDSKRLETFTGLSPKDIHDLKRNISQKYGGLMRSAYDLFKIEQSNIISAGLSGLDNLLKGGLYPGQIYEVCGISSSGKTQLCFTIACNVAVKSNAFVRYIDTKGDFSGSRVEQILLKRYEQQVVDEAMDRIKVCKVQNLKELLKVLRWLTGALKEEEACRTRIIIIDSLPGIIFKFFKQNETAVALNHLANICHLIANEFHLSIIIVNLITQWTSTDKESAGTSSSGTDNKVIPLLGKYWSGVPNTRLLIEKVGFQSRKLSVWKSFQLKQNLSCTFNINDFGVLCT